MSNKDKLMEQIRLEYRDYSNKRVSADVAIAFISGMGTTLRTLKQAQDVLEACNRTITRIQMDEADRSA